MQVFNVSPRFVARVITKGEPYGREGSGLVASDMIVEFYDAKHLDRFGPIGQFVTRYYASTLRDHGDAQGLCLDGGVPEWQIDADAMRKVLNVIGKKS